MWREGARNEHEVCRSIRLFWHEEYTHAHAANRGYVVKNDEAFQRGPRTVLLSISNQFHYIGKHLLHPSPNGFCFDYAMVQYSEWKENIPCCLAALIKGVLKNQHRFARVSRKCIGIRG